MSDDLRTCGSCGGPLHDGDAFVVAEPLLSMRAIGAGEVLVAGAPQRFHPHHVPDSSRWRVLTS